MNGIILSICDYTGNWSEPFRQAGYTTIRVDPKLTTHVEGNDITYGMTIQEFNDRYLDNYAYSILGILMAPPCTHFCSSGANLWRVKDKKGITAKALEIVDACLATVPKCPNLKFWCLENSKGRLPKLRKLGALYTFHPYRFAKLADDPMWEAYTKLTCLWGNFAYPVQDYRLEVKPDHSQGYGKLFNSVGRDYAETKEIRSITPMGFSRAFAKAQIEKRLT